MTAFVSKRGDLMIKCDGCEIVALVMEGCEDKTEANTFVRKNGWATKKDASGKWYHLCPECGGFVRQKLREKNLSGVNWNAGFTRRTPEQAAGNRRQTARPRTSYPDMPPTPWGDDVF